MIGFEEYILMMDQFHKKFENRLELVRVVSQLDPDLCIIDSTTEDLVASEQKGTIADRSKFQRGLFLNLHCNLHSSLLNSINSAILFGGTKRRSETTLVSKLKQQERQSSMLPVDFDDENALKKVKEKRILRF